MIEGIMTVTLSSPRPQQSLNLIGKDPKIGAKAKTQSEAGNQ